MMRSMRMCAMNPDDQPGMDDQPGTDEVAGMDEVSGMDDVTAASEPGGRSRRRRIRRTESHTPDPRGPLLVLIAIGIGAAVIAASAAIPRMPATTTPPPVVEPIDSSVVICPEPGGVDGVVATSAVTLVDDLPGQDRAGVAALSYLGAANRPVDVITGDGVGLTKPGASVQVVNDSGRVRPLLVTAEGGLAPGLVAAQYELGLSGPRRGIASLNCPAPSPTWWFVGGGSSSGRTTTMYLVNPETSDAEVDVRLFGPDGPITANSLRGLVVPAQSRTAIPLTRVAPAIGTVVWNVQVRTGRIVAAVQDIDAEGFIPRGIDWIPPSADPATRVVIPGVVGGDGGRQLTVHAPGDVDAVVAIRVVTEEGAFTPVDLPEVEVEAGTVVTVAIGNALQGAPATLELVSDVPIVAGLRMRHSGVDASAADIREEVSFATGATAVNGTAAAAGLPAVRGTGVTLWLTALSRNDTDDDTDTEVTVRVLPFGADVSAPDPIEVSVPADRVTPVELPRIPNAGWFTVVVTPSRPGVYVAQTSIRRGARGTLFSGYPLTSLRTTVTIPSAGQSLSLSVAP
jgi:hypothetical protein